MFYVNPNRCCSNKKLCNKIERCIDNDMDMYLYALRRGISSKEDEYFSDKTWILIYNGESCTKQNQYYTFQKKTRVVRRDSH